MTPSRPDTHTASHVAARLAARLAPRRRAFSLPELLVSLGIIAVLFSLLTPALGRAKRDMVELRCVTRSAELTRLMHAYANDYRAMPPMIHSDDPAHLRTTYARLWYAMQHATVLRSDMWRSWVGPNEMLYRCGAHSTGRVSYDHPVDFRITKTLLARPEVFAADATSRAARPDFGARGQRLDAAIFPDAKVLIYEHDVWHSFAGDASPGTDIATLEYHNSPRRSAVAFFDGHAALRWPRDARPPVHAGKYWSIRIYATTRDGVRGRDF